MIRLRAPGPAPYRLFSAARGTGEDLGPVPSAAWATFTPDGKALIGLNTDPLRVEKYRLDTRRSEVVVDLREQSLAFGATRECWPGEPVEAAPRADGTLRTPADGQRPRRPEGTPSYRPWAQLLARTFAVDVPPAPSATGG